MSGTPVIIDGTLSTAAPENLTEIAGNAVVAATAGVQEVGLRAEFSTAGDTPLLVIGSASDSAGTADKRLEVHSLTAYYNDGTGVIERGRNNTQGTLLASAARTATATSATQTNYNARGVQVIIAITVASGTGGLTLEIDGQDPVSGNWYALATAAAALTTTVTRVYESYPGSSTTNSFILVTAGHPLPRTWRVVVTAGDSSSYTYSVGYALIL